MQIDLPEIIPGTDYPLRLKYTNCDGTPEPQAGNTVRVVVKTSPTATSALFDQVFTATDPDAADGVIFAPIPGASTTEFPRNSKVWLQAQRTTTDGDTDTPLLTQIDVVQELIE